MILAIKIHYDNPDDLVKDLDSQLQNVKRMIDNRSKGLDGHPDYGYEGKVELLSWTAVV